MNLFLKILIAFVCTSLSSVCTAQLFLEKQYSFPLENVSAISSDSYGNLYLSNKKGHIFKYDIQGKKIVTFSPTKNGDISLLQGNRNVNIFAFYEEYQEYKILSRFLTEISTNRIPNDKVGYAKLATLASDNSLWIIDQNDYSLKKLNLKFNRLEVNNPLQSMLLLEEYDFSYIQEYNTNLYLSDKQNGILVFDNLGNYKTKIPGKGINYFSFFQDNIYFLSEGQLVIINLLTGKEDKVSIPEKDIEYVIINQETVLFITKYEAKVLKHKLPIK